jgi:hypothetical protein
LANQTALRPVAAVVEDEYGIRLLTLGIEFLKEVHAELRLSEVTIDFGQRAAYHRAGTPVGT